MGQPIFTPKNFYGLEVWYDASTLTAGTISTWLDLSGNGRNGTPTDITCVAGVTNGKNVARFNGTTSTMAMPTSVVSSLANKDITIVLVLNSSNVTDQLNTILVTHPLPTPYLYVGIPQNIAYDARFNYGVTGSSAAGAWGGFINTTYVWTCDAGEYSSANIYRDNTNIATIATTNSRVAWGADVMQLGGDALWGVGGWWVGDVSEVMIFSRKLSTTERTAINQYLGNKWGVVI